MFKIEPNEVTMDRSRSTRTLNLIGGIILMLSSSAMFAFTIHLSQSTGQNKYQLLAGDFVFAFVFCLGGLAISQSGPYRLMLRRSTGDYIEETTRLGRRSIRTGPLTDFKLLQLKPLKQKDAGCVINLCRRGRPLFPIQLEMYDDYAEARADLQRLTVATGIPIDDSEAATAHAKYIR
jgi:hypothetical protein